MKRLSAIALVTLAACHSGPEPAVPKYVGGPFEAVVKKMGYPQSQREFEGDTVYSWTDTYLKTRIPILIHSRMNCTMDVGVRDGIVKAISYNGDPGPCSELENKLLY